ncbi:hypothetical protein [Mollivirus kamchatka]|nr:hypothetical protein [Mollivirus kamchatka]
MTTTTATTTRQDEERLFNLDLIQRTLGAVWREAPCSANIVFGNSVFWTETSGEGTRWVRYGVESLSWLDFVEDALEAMMSPTFVLHVAIRPPSSIRQTTTALTWMDTYSAVYCKHRLCEALHDSNSRADVIAILEIALARYALESSMSGWNEYDIIDHIRSQVGFGYSDGYHHRFGQQRSLHFVAFVLPLLYGIEAGFTRSLFTYMATRPEHVWADGIGSDLRTAFLESERQYDDATIEFAVTHLGQPALAYVHREPFAETASDSLEPFIFTSGLAAAAAHGGSPSDDQDIEKTISRADRLTLDQLLVAARLKRNVTGFARDSSLVSFFDGEHSHLDDISMSQTYLAQALDEFTCLDEPTAQTTIIVEAACSTLIDVVTTRYAHLLDKDESIADVLWRLRLALDTARALHHRDNNNNNNSETITDLDIQAMCI